MQSVKPDMFGNRRLNRMNITPTAILNSARTPDVSRISQSNWHIQQSLNRQFIGIR